MKRWYLAWLILPAFLLLAGTTIKRGPGGGSGGGGGSALLSGDGPAATSAGRTITFPDVDDEPGLLDGFGADPSPMPGSMVTKARFSQARIVGGLPYQTWAISDLYNFNSSGIGVWENPNMYSFHLAYENFWGDVARSGAPLTEFYWQQNPQSHYFTFANTAATATTTVADLYTFSDGAVCRSMLAGQSLDNSVARMSCVNGIDPANGATLVSGASCVGTCTGDETGATVTTAVLDTAWRPFFYELFTSINRVNWRQNRGRDGSGALGVFIMGDGANGHLFLGRANETDTNSVPVGIPHENAYTNDLDTLHFPRGGDIGVDTSDDGGATGYFTFVADNSYDSTGSYGLHPTTTQCFEQTDLDATDDNRVIPITAYQRVKVVAFGCGNNTTAIGSVVTPATLTLEDGAGNAITLSGTMTCSGNDEAMAWTTTTDADAILTSGERLRFDTTNTPNAATDEHTICVAYQYYKV